MPKYQNKIEIKMRKKTLKIIFELSPFARATISIAPVEIWNTIKAAEISRNELLSSIFRAKTERKAMHNSDAPKK